MNHPFQLDLCKAYLKSTATPENPALRLPKPDGPVITISRAAGARGNSIAAELVEQLEHLDTIRKYRPWTLFNQNLLKQVIEEHHLPETSANYFPEDKCGEISSVIAEVLGLHPGTYNCAVKTAETILRLARTGNTLIVGRGANLITANVAHALHVRLIGSVEARTRHYARHAGITRQEAAAEIARLDRARKLYIKSTFHKDIDDPLLYDLTIKTDYFTDSQVASLIIDALEKKMKSNPVRLELLPA